MVINQGTTREQEIFGNEKCSCWNSQGSLQTVEHKEKGNREKIKKMRKLV